MVNDIESALGEAMRAAVEGTRPRHSVLDVVRRRHRRWKFRMAAGSAAAVAVAVTTALTFGNVWRHGGPPASGGAQWPAAHHRYSPPPRGWIRHRDGPGANGDWIDTPAAWHVKVNALPGLAGPSVLWAIGTGPIPESSGCGPTAALRKLPPAGVLFVVMEYGNPAGEPYTFPPRGEHLALGPVGLPECWGVPTRVALFEDAGRYFQVQVVFGPKATAALRNQVRQSLDTLHIARIPGTELPAAFCRSGQWTYCPQAAWVYEVMNKAGVFHLGAQGTQAIVAQSGTTPARSFSLRTTAPQLGLQGGRCRSVAGTRVCLVGNRLAVAVHRLLLWLEPTSTAITHAKAGLPTRPALRRLIEAAVKIPVP